MRVLRRRFPPDLTAQEGLVLGLTRVLEPGRAADWARRVTDARADWTSDFGGSQFALGRPFYTHLESDRADLYFREVVRSDARVERVLPGMQGRMRDVFATLVGGTVRQRPGFSGAGVHVFEPGSPVARRGGTIHFDVEGLSPLHVARRARVFSLVVMLQPASWGGGLAVFDALFEGSEDPSPAALASRRVVLGYGAGDGVLLSSRRLHQIRPFRGTSPRISITLHGVEVDRGVFETWF
jgi:hypothetical protein